MEAEIPSSVYNLVKNTERVGKNPTPPPLQPEVKLQQLMRVPEYAGFELYGAALGPYLLFGMT